MNDDLAPRGDPAHDQLGKVRPLIDHLSDRFVAQYEPSKDVAVDETIINFQGPLVPETVHDSKADQAKVWVLGNSSNRHVHWEEGGSSSRSWRTRSPDTDRGSKG